MVTPSRRISPRFRRAAALGSASALAAVGALHLAWGVGSSWPARSRSELAVLVSGSPVMPGPGPCLVVGVGLLATGVVLGSRRRTRTSTRLRWAVAAGLAARAAVGGRVAARSVGLPAPDPVFLSWDRRCYRPLCAVLAAGLLAGRL